MNCLTGSHFLGLHTGHLLNKGGVNLAPSSHRIEREFSCSMRRNSYGSTVKTFRSPGPGADSRRAKCEIRCENTSQEEISRANQSASFVAGDSSAQTATR